MRLRALFEKTFFELNARNRMKGLANVKREKERSLQSVSSFVVLRIGAIIKWRNTRKTHTTIQQLACVAGVRRWEGKKRG